MRLRDRNLLRALMVAFALSGSSLFAMACDDDSRVEDAAEDVGDAVEDTAEDIEDAVEDATD